MPSKLHPISPADLYRKTFDRKHFKIVVGKKYYESRYFNNPGHSLKQGRMVVYVESSPEKARIGIITGTTSDGLYLIVVIPQQHLRSEFATLPRHSVHESDIYAYLQEVEVKKKNSGKPLWRLYSKVFRDGDWKENTIEISSDASKLLGERAKLQRHVFDNDVPDVHYCVSTVSQR